MKTILSIFSALACMADASILDSVKLKVDVSALSKGFVDPVIVNTNTVGVLQYGEWVSWTKAAFTAGVRIYESATEGGAYSFLIDMGNKEMFFVETQEGQSKFIKAQAYSTRGISSVLTDPIEILPERNFNVKVTPAKALALNHDGTTSLWTMEILISDNLQIWRKPFQHVLHEGVYTFFPKVTPRAFFKPDPAWSPYYGYAPSP